MKNKCEKIKRCTIVGVLILCLISAPFVLQKSKNPLIVSHYDAVLSYIGTFLAAMLGMAGIILTIIDSQNARKEDLIQSMKPFFILNPILVVNDFSIFSVAKDNMEVGKSPDYLSEEYQEYKFEKLFFVVSDSGARVQLNLNRRQKELVHKNGFETIKSKGGNQLLIKNSLLYFRFESANVGKGVAVNCQIGLQKMDLTKPLFPQMKSVNCCVPLEITNNCTY